MIAAYVYEAEQFVAEWTRADPAPPSMYDRGGALYQRNDPFPEEYLNPVFHTDFESLNKLESESDFYIARYKQSQHDEITANYKRGQHPL